MQAPVNGREWTKLLKHLDLFGAGIDLFAAEEAPPAFSNQDGSSNQKVPEGAGYIEVDGHELKIYNGDSQLLNPWIKAQSPIVLSVNNVIVNEAVQVASTDHVEITFEPYKMFSLMVSEDRLEVNFQIHSEKKYVQRLKNNSKVYEMTLLSETDESSWTEELKLEHVLTAISKMKIKATVDDLAIRNEIALFSKEEVIIARGVAPIPSIDARIEKFFTDEVQNHVPLPDDRDVVDFRNHLVIPSVKSGELLARLTPSVPGKNGTDVYGETIVPTPPKNFSMKVKQYCRINEQNEVFALKAGRPAMHGKDILEFEVVPCFEWHSDVDFKCGNIFFDGDVIINGNVMEAMFIEARGRVTINGSVYRGTISASNSVIVNGKVISGAIYAGQEPPHFQQLRQMTNDIHEQWTQWVQTARFVSSRLQKAGQAVRRGSLLMSLIHTKFQELPRRIRMWLALEQHLTPSPDSPIVHLAESLRKMNGPQFWSEDGSFEFLEQLERELQQASLPPGGNLVKASITIDQCQLSDFRASGDIIVRKEGSIQSNIVGEGSVMFLDGSAICRGGQVIAGDRVVCAALGSEMGGVTMVKAGKEIVAQQMNQGKIYIGRHMREIWSPIRKMKAYVQHNNLVVTGTLD